MRFEREPLGVRVGIDQRQVKRLARAVGNPGLLQRAEPDRSGRRRAEQRRHAQGGKIPHCEQVAIVRRL